MNAQTEVKKLPAVIQAVEQRLPELKKLLPPHVSTDQFMASFKVAALRTPGMLECTPRSVVLGCVQAASDGLMLDGREAVLVVYNVKKKMRGDDGRTKEVWVKEAVYQAMYLGLLKRVRWGSDVAKIEARVVRDNDHFVYSYGDDASITHKPRLAQPQGEPIAVYAIAFFKDHTIQFEVMDIEEVNAIRARSKGWDPEEPKGPWHTDYLEMAKKTVLKRLAKLLPQASGAPLQPDADDDEDAVAALDYFPEDGLTDDEAAQAQATNGKALDKPAGDPTSRMKPTVDALTKQPTSATTFQGDWDNHLDDLEMSLSSASTRDKVEELWTVWDAQFDNVPEEITARAKKLVDGKLYALAKGDA